MYSRPPGLPRIWLNDVVTSLALANEYLVRKALSTLKGFCLHLFSHYTLHPVHKLDDPGVDARLALGAPARAKADEAHLVPRRLLARRAHEKRATGVTVAAVFPCYESG